MSGTHSMMKTGFLLIAFVALAGCSQEPTEPTTTTVIMPARPTKVERVVERKTIIVHDKPAPATHTTVVVPAQPGAAGPPGPAGAPGAQGAPGMPAAPTPEPTPEGGSPDGGVK